MYPCRLFTHHTNINWDATNIRDDLLTRSSPRFQLQECVNSGEDLVLTNYSPDAFGKRPVVRIDDPHVKCVDVDVIQVNLSR